MEQSKASKSPDNGSKAGVQAKRLVWYEMLALRLVAAFAGLWGCTFRFHWGRDVQAILDGELPPCVIIFWHNRLFIAPYFYKRYFKERKLGLLVSPSKDGAWSAGFAEILGILPVRGSRAGGRSTQAVRDLIAAGKAGYDITFTPDGSRGPMYDMKAGAVIVAMKTGAPVLLLSFNCERAWRLKSWDRFYLPKPFSRIEVRMDFVGDESGFDGGDAKQVSLALKERLDAMTDDSKCP